MERYKTSGENTKKLAPETRKFFPPRPFLDIDKTTILNSLLFFATGTPVTNYIKDTLLKELHSRNLIEVHRASTTSISGLTATLLNGVSFPCNTAIFTTGWDLKLIFFDPPTAIQVGTTAPLTEETPKTAVH
ncbi:hypothetical protein F5882DRAFT_386827 [Hyaloscypha sp. PMI_1271]|nr:hypothetical protein F5882DRAFT_386827 [Hyaloscypha sp. PMI_1271]